MRYLLTTLFFAFLLFSCSTDFVLEGEWKDIPIVYGLISVDDTAHYVRVEKAFLEPGGNAEQIARIPDSLYYNPSVVIQMENKRTGKTVTLQRVDGSLEGYPRDPGPFAETPNILYKVKYADLQLKGGDEVELTINRGDQLPLVTSSTTMVGELTPVTNAPPPVFFLGDYISTRRISWKADENAVLFDVRATMHYLESDPDNPTQFLEKEAEWIMSRSFNRDGGSNQVNFSFKSEEFFLFVAGALNPIANGARRFESLDFHITAAGQDFVDLQRIVQANGGITSSNQLPVFSNISEGLGIFASRSKLDIEGITLASSGIDSLVNGIYTKDLSFIE